MSYTLVNQALAMPLPPARRMVLLALADMANGAGVCWPSIATLARRASTSVRSVFTHLAELVKAGLISKTTRIGRSSLYHLALEPAATSTHADGDERTESPAPTAAPATAAAPQAERVHTTPTPVPKVAPAPTIAPEVLTVETVVQAMRRAGLMGSYECGSLAALVASASPTDGLTEFTEAATEATQRGKGFAWALARVKGQRTDRAAREATTPSQPGRDPVLIQLEQDAAQAVPVPLSIRERLARLKAEIVGAVAGSTAGAGA